MPETRLYERWWHSWSWDHQRIILIFRQKCKKSSFMRQRESTLCSLVKHFDILWSTMVYCSALINLQLHAHVYSSCKSTNNKTAAVKFLLKTKQTPPTASNPLDAMPCNIMPQVAITINGLGQSGLHGTDGSFHKGRSPVLNSGNNYCVRLLWQDPLVVCRVGSKSA